MSNFYDDTFTYEGILQGDIFKVGSLCNQNFLDHEEWGMVITADCDIAQEKISSFAFLPIITAKSYLDKYWLITLLEKEKHELLKNITNSINDKKYLEKQNCKPIDISEVKEWIEEESVEGVFKELGISLNKNRIPKFHQQYEILSQPASFENFFILRNIQGRKEDAIKKEIRTVFSSLKDEFYFVPYVGAQESFGVIVKLRSLRTIDMSIVYHSLLKARSSSVDINTTLYRVGRFSDYLRYSISQKFALLFSKIGMPEHYESDVEASLNIIADSLWESSNEI
jgi:hypothetical protein